MAARITTILAFFLVTAHPSLAVSEATLQELRAERPEQRRMAILDLSRDASRASLEALAAYLETEPEPALRRAARDAMLRMPLDEPLLIEILGSSDLAQARTLAANALGHHRSQPVRAVLLAALTDASPDVRLEVYEALVTFGDRSVVSELVRAALREQNPSLRQVAERAATTLAGQNLPPEDVPSALATLEGGQLADQLRAVIVLGQSRDWRALTPLSRAAREGSMDLRRAAISAMGELGDHRAVPILLELLGSTRGETRYRVIGALANLGDESSMDRLGPLLRDDDVQTRVLAARAIGWMHLPGSAWNLEAALSDASEEVRIEALLALARFPKGETTPLLKIGLGDPSPFHRAEAARQIGLLDDASGVPLLIELLRDSDPLVRLTAADALAELGASEAAEPLRKVIEKTRNQEEIESYQRALSRITGDE